MFPSQHKHFKSIDCPEYSKKGKCKLPHCIFKHDKLKRKTPEPVLMPKAVLSAGTPSAKREETQAPPAKKPKIELIPATLAHPPSSYPIRLQHLKVVHSKLEDSGVDPGKCIELAVKLEQEEAERSIEGTYKGNIRNLVRRITRREYTDESQQAKAEKAARTERQILDEELGNLVIPLEKLRNYITAIPKGEYEQPDWFECDRCKQKVRFVDIPKNLEERVNRCQFHLLRRPWNPETKRLDQVFPCCGATLEEEACENRFTHVYKLVEPTALHYQVPFINTPDVDCLFAVGIDCEMAYTTKGMELIRVTAINWVDDKVVYDRIVRPSGTILDLNTRWSGVSDISEGITVEGIHFDPISFQQARTELFEIIGSRTILVGHGLENDLIAMRIIHHRIVDTAILYPRVKTRTHSLKQLSWMFLSRIIQTGEHDSFEDSLAAMDIIRADIRNRLLKK